MCESVNNANFSVVTPSYNNIDGLRRCIGSVRGQSNAGLEQIVMDGASTDGTVAWLTGLQQPEDVALTARIESSAHALRWRSAPDHGMYDAIGKGWELARGEILSWLNCDEQYLPGTLARVAQVFTDDPGADVVFGDTIIVAPDGVPLASRREIPLRPGYLKNGFLYALSCATFFRRRLRDEGLLRLDGRYRYAADMELVLRLLSVKKRVRHIPFALALFGVDGGNLSATQAAAMAQEVEAIRKTYRAVPRPLRVPYRAMRCLERLVSGCYRPASVSYDFALDEVPSYRHIPPTRIGFRFSYVRTVRQLAGGRAPKSPRDC